MPGPRRDTTKYVAFPVEVPDAGSLARLARDRIEDLIALIAVAQHGVVALEQLVALGLSHAAVRARVSAGRLHRVHRGVYSLAPVKLLSRNGHYMAAVLACGPGAALSHRSAAALLELIAWSPSKVDVSVPTPGGRSRRDAIRVHRATTLRPEDIVLVHRIPCTTVARTLLDLAEALDSAAVERALDQGAKTEVLDFNELKDQIARNQRRPAAAALQGILDAHAPGSTPTWNEFEKRMFALCRRIGLPDPEAQQWLDLGDGRPLIRPDFMWRAQRVIVETDGWETHGKRRSFESDRRRDQRATLAGWRPIRVTWLHLTNESERIEGLLLGLVAGARR